MVTKPASFIYRWDGNSGRSLAAVSACCLMIASLTFHAPFAQAEPGLLMSDASARDSATLSTGEQLLLENRDGPMSFAGHNLALNNFTGVIGFASEVAYVAVISGSATTGGKRAGSGRILMLPPYGSNAIVQRFDAARFRDGWNSAVRSARPGIFSQLVSLAGQQKRGMFIGRFSSTGFNIAAPGRSDDEMARRTVKGSEAVQAIRFSGESAPESIEQKVVDSFLSALARGDAATVAGLMDPVPFGNTDLRNGAEEARVLMAQALISRRDWAASLGKPAVQRTSQPNTWRIQGSALNATLVLRPMGDFIFVRSISVEGQS